MAVAVRTHIEKLRSGPEGSWYFTSGYFKYRTHELLSRMDERKRASNDIKEATKKLAVIRSQIFDKMGVPVKFRHL